MPSPILTFEESTDTPFLISYMLLLFFYSIEFVIAYYQTFRTAPSYYKSYVRLIYASIALCSLSNRHLDRMIFNLKAFIKYSYKAVEIFLVIPSLTYAMIVTLVIEIFLDLKNSLLRPTQINQYLCMKVIKIVVRVAIVINIVLVSIVLSLSDNSWMINHNSMLTLNVINTVSWVFLCLILAYLTFEVKGMIGKMFESTFGLDVMRNITKISAIFLIMITLCILIATLCYNLYGVTENKQFKAFLYFLYFACFDLIAHAVLLMYLRRIKESTTDTFSALMNTITGEDCNFTY